MGQWYIDKPFNDFNVNHPLCLAPKDGDSIAAVLEKSEDLAAGTDETMQTPEVQAETGSQDDSKDEISSQVMNTENESIVKDEGTKTSGIKKKKAVLSKNGGNVY